ncbi:TonB-dependent receptor [Hymenobacter latericus]|uniref:TonB-dependent receptor n=1 Tax=Hymenobacter sp. YIM 151858-1 TaxID=2987688 RepID=UPI00222719D4|nr:TonB-dependent receptor [Hymenobacter sp. YIM 151858-1]UYZ59504.1 TonB-dependent receptor [Hymenobacter sp. YIM 151858-1]
MKRLLPLVLLLLLAALGRVSAQTATALSGTVRDAQGQPLPGANVFLKTTFDGATADSLGRFRFSTQQTGTLPLVVTLMGYEVQERLVVLDGVAKRFAVVLKPVRNQLGDVTITAGAFEASDEKRSTVLTTRDVQTTAGALADINGALNTLPGTSRVGEEGKLFVRGGAAGETKQYLDGLPLQSPYNASVAGVPARGRFSPNLFKGTVFSTGGYSAEFGQALSAVVGLKSYDLADETQTGVSLLSVGLGLSHQQRFERSSVAATLDYTNLQPYYGLVPQEWGWLKAPQSLGGSVALRQRTGDMGMLKVYGAFTRSEFGLRQPDPDFAGGRPIGLQNQNHYLNATFRSPLRRGWSVQTGVAGTRDAQTVRPDVQYLHDLEQSVVGRVVLTNDSAGTYWNLKLGAEGLGQRYQQQYQASGEAPLQRLGFEEARVAAFAESDIAFSNNLVARAGGRAEYSKVLGRWNAAPRLALAYQLSEGEQLSGAWGYFYQTPANDLMRIGQYAANLRFERAAHYLVTYQRIKNNRTFRGEAYYKDYAHLTRYAAPALGTNVPLPFVPAAYQSTGKGYARGVDVFWRDRKSVKGLDYWVSYGLLDTRRQQRADPQLAVPTFASRHNFSVVGKYWFNKLHTLVGATYSYASPRPYYNPNLPGYNQARTPSYQDLSLNLSYVTSIGKNLTIVHLACSNVLGRDNVFGYRYANTPDATGTYQGVAVTPSAPRMFFAGLLISINKKRPADTNTAPE